MKSYSKGLVPIIVAIIILVGLGLVLGLSKLKDFKLPPTTSQLPSPFPTSTPDPTADWKTYTSSKYNYSFKYPAGWYLLAELDEAEYGVTTLSDYDLKKDQMPKTGPKIEISFVNVSLKDREKFINKRLENYMGSSFVSNPTLTIESEITIGNLSTQKITIFDNSDKFYINEFIAFPNDSQGVLVTHYRSELKKDLTKQILSTFKFLDSSKTVTKGACISGGCSQELCFDESGSDLVSICIYKDEYACYKNAKCERQSNGQCGWTQTEELKACLNKY